MLTGREKNTPVRMFITADGGIVLSWMFNFFLYLIPMPHALLSFSPIMARAFFRMLVTFFIIFLSFCFYVLQHKSRGFCFPLYCHVGKKYAIGAKY